MGQTMHNTLTRPARLARRTKGARAVAVALPTAGFHDHGPTVATGAPQRPAHTERLAWPVAAAAILGTSALLWLGIIAAARAILLG
jgi:hypothetical protein